MIYMNRKDRMIEHGHFFKDRYKFHVMPSPGYHWTLEVSRVCGWWAWQDFSQHDAPRSFCNWAKNTKNALLLNSKFWKQSGRLVHEQVVLDKFGKLDVAAPLIWKSDKYFFQVLSDISLYLVQSSSFFICFQERKAPRRFMRTRLKSLLQKRQDGATHKDLAVFFGPKIGSAIGVVLDTKSLRWCRWSRFFSFRAFRMVLLQFLVSQPAFFFFPQERMLRRREKLWDLEKELESVHTKSKSYKPKCLCWWRGWVCLKMIGKPWNTPQTQEFIIIYIIIISSSFISWRYPHFQMKPSTVSECFCTTCSDSASQTRRKNQGFSG